MTPLPLYTGDVRAVVEQTPARSVSKDCAACELATTARTICTPGDGPEDAPVLVLLPGVSDAADRAGHVVAGTVPEWVARTLGAGGAAIRYEAAVRCRVGGSVPSDTMLHACRPYTAGSLPRRKRIIAVGQSAHRLLLGRALPLTVRRGIALLSDGTPVVMLGDPVVAMKNRLLRARYEEDLRWALAVEAPAAPWGLVTQVVDTAADAQAACDEARSWPWVALDAEWAGVIDDPDHTLLSIAIGTQGDRSFVWDRAGLADPAVAEPLRALLRDRSVTVVGHNAKADFRALRAWLGGWPRGKWTDTRMLRKVQDAESSGALDDLAETVGMGGHKAEARAALETAKAQIRKGQRKASAPAGLFAERSDYGSMPRLYESLPRDVLLRYNARDTVATARLYVSELAALDSDDPALRYVLEGLVVPATLAICRIEQAGVPCDPTGLGAVDALWAVEQQQIEARLVTASPNAWKPGSPRDVARVLYGELGLRCPGKTDSGAPSTDADALDKLKGQHPVVDDLIAWRKVSKLRGTYSTGLASEVRPDGRIRPSFLVDGARTGRLSCSAGWTPVLTARGTVRLDAVQPGDLVWTHRHRWREVVRFIDQGVRDVYAVRLSNGHVLTCTGDHRLLLSDGRWLTVEEIKHERVAGVGREGIESRGCAAALPGSYFANHRGDRFATLHDDSQCRVGRPKVLARGGTACVGGLALLRVENGRQEPHEGQNGRGAPPLGRRVRGRVRLSDLPMERETPVCSPCGDGAGARACGNPRGSGCPPYRQQPQEQQTRQPGLGDTFRAPHHSFLAGAGSALVAVEEINACGSIPVYDLTVAEDESFATCGVFSHNCSEPNMQNVPRGDTTSGKMLRDVFAARPGWTFVQADYSQLELRVAAGLAKDEEMIAVFRSGVDYHLRTAQMISKQAWGIEPEEVTKVHRTATKAVNFGLLYGSDDRSLAETLGGTVADAAKVRAAVLGRFKGLAAFIQGCLKDARTTGGAWTVWRGKKARRRPLWGIADPDAYLRGHYERASWNTPIQGTGSDICLDALVEIVDWIEADGVPAELVLPIHDSLMIHCQDDALDEVIYQMRRIMESRWCGDCPLAVDVEVGKSWGSLEKLKK